jgi:hypothetical protein
VINTPSVHVGNTPNVNVANTTTNPVPIIGTVQNADNPARHAVQQDIAINLTTTTSGITTISIPKGKIFVLETVSFFASVPVGTVEQLSITTDGTRLDGTVTSGTYQLVVPPPNTPGLFNGSQALRV